MGPCPSANYNPYPFYGFSYPDGNAAISIYNAQATCSVNGMALAQNFSLPFTVNPGDVSPGTEVDLYAEVIYTGVDNLTSTAIGSTIAATAPFATSDFTMTFTDLPFSVMAASDVATYSVLALQTSGFASLSDFPCSGVSTLGYAIAKQTLILTAPVTTETDSSTTTQLVPSSTTVTSTLTNQFVTEAPRVTTSVTDFEGTATETADPSYVTNMKTLTPRPARRTKHVTTTIRRHCPRGLEYKPVFDGLVERDDNDPVTTCGNYVNGTVVPATTTTTVTTYIAGGVETDTAYDIVNSTSTYTATDSVFMTDPVSTTTVTPTLTDATFTLLPRTTKTVTRTRTKHTGKKPHHCRPTP